VPYGVCSSCSADIDICEEMSDQENERENLDAGAKECFDCKREAKACYKFCHWCDEEYKVYLDEDEDELDDAEEDICGDCRVIYYHGCGSCGDIFFRVLDDYEDGLCPKCEIEEGDDAVCANCRTVFTVGEDTSNSGPFEYYKAVCEECQKQAEVENHERKEQKAKKDQVKKDQVKKDQVKKVTGETSRTGKLKPGQEKNGE